MAFVQICVKLEEATHIKEQIRQATKTKDVSIPDDAPFSEFASYISNIPGHLQTGKVLIPTAAGSTELPDEGYDGFYNVVLPEEPNLVGTNIVTGTSIFGVPGEVEIPEFDLTTLFNGSLTEFRGLLAELRNYAMYNYTNLTSIVLNNLTKMGTYAFYGCSKVTEASFEMLEELSDYSMQNCTALVTLNDDVLKIIGSYALHSCGNLVNINLEGVEQIKDYGLYNCRKVTGIGVLTTPVIGAYGCYYLAYSDAETFDFIPVGIASVGNYGMSYAKVAEVDGEFNNIGQYAFACCNSLTKMKAKINGPVNSYGLAYMYYMHDLDLSESNITTLNTYAFYQTGYNRVNKDTDRLIFDLRNSSFPIVQNYAFAGNNTTSNIRNADIYLPSTVTQLNQYAFRYAKDVDIFFSSEEPPTLSTTNIFSGATNYRLFAPYQHLNAWMTTTKSNWSTYIDSVVGYAAGGTFETGSTLPDTNLEGHALTWYSDVEKTTVVTTVEDGAATYYCTVGEHVAWILSASVDDYTEMTVIDNTGVSYAEYPALVPVGRTLTIDVADREGWSNNTSVNGVKVELPYSFEITQDTTIVSRSWEGDIDPDFENCTWENVQKAVIAGVAADLFELGATRTITTKSGANYTLRIANNTTDMYPYADGSGATGFVMEFVELLPTTYYMNPSSTNTGGWNASYMRNTVVPLVWDDLPDDLKAVIATVKTKSCYSGNDGTLVESDDTLFLPSEREIFGTRTYSRTEEWDALQRWQYYAEHDDNASRIKKNASGNANFWWNRSPNSGNSNFFTGVNSSGTAGGNTAGSYGVAFGFCI